LEQERGGLAVRDVGTGGVGWWKMESQRVAGVGEFLTGGVGGRENQNRGKKVKTGVTAVEYRKRNNRSRSRESRPAWSTLQNLLVLRQSKLERFLLPFIVSRV
jgi:hypothetical protein